MSSITPFQSGPLYLYRTEPVAVYDPTDPTDFQNTLTHEMGHAYNHTPGSGDQSPGLVAHPHHYIEHGGIGPHCSTILKDGKEAKGEEVDGQDDFGNTIKVYATGVCVMFHSGPQPDCLNRYCDTCTPAETAPGKGKSMQDQIDKLLASYSDLYTSPEENRTWELESKFGDLEYDGIYIGAPDQVDAAITGIPTITLTSTSMQRMWDANGEQNSVIIAINLDLLDISRLRKGLSRRRRVRGPQTWTPMPGLTAPYIALSEKMAASRRVRIPLASLNGIGRQISAPW